MTRPVALPRGFGSLLLELSRKPSLQLEALKQIWEELDEDINKNEQKLVKKTFIPDDDPLRNSINLLSPIGRARDEDLHTEAITYILNEKNGNGFERDVLTL
jgi:hypothetical protein